MHGELGEGAWEKACCSLPTSRSSQPPFDRCSTVPYLQKNLDSLFFALSISCLSAYSGTRLAPLALTVVDRRHALLKKHQAVFHDFLTQELDSCVRSSLSFAFSPSSDDQTTPFYSPHLHIRHPYHRLQAFQDPGFS